MFSGKRRAFTLAEVLATLAIIGIVAAMTIPSLVGTFQKKIYYTGMKTAYSKLKNAHSIAIGNQGISYPNFTNNTDVRDFYIDYIKFAKICDAGSFNDCFAVPNYRLHGVSPGISASAAAIDVSGMLYRFDYDSSTCSDDDYNYKGEDISCGDISIDINGFTGPNTFGRDIFYFRITRIGIVPAGVENEKYHNWSSFCNPTGSTNTHNGHGCAGKLMQDRGMDY